MMQAANFQSPNKRKSTVVDGLTTQQNLKSARSEASMQETASPYIGQLLSSSK